jgi:hypothetical protein
MMAATVSNPNGGEIDFAPLSSQEAEKLQNDSVLNSGLISRQRIA